MADGHRRDAAAYSELVRARSHSLFRTAYLMVGDHQLAQDLLQESLVKTYVAWPRLRDVTKAEGRKGRTTRFTFTVRLSATYDQPVTVSFKSVNGTATTLLGTPGRLRSLTGIAM